MSVVVQDDQIFQRGFWLSTLEQRRLVVPRSNRIDVSALCHDGGQANTSLLVLVAHAAPRLYGRGHDAEDFGQPGNVARVSDGEAHPSQRVGGGVEDGSPRGAFEGANLAVDDGLQSTGDRPTICHGVAMMVKVEWVVVGVM